jgi:hypothetical protein
MKKYLVKYESYTGNVYTVEVSGFDEQTVISKLLNCKELYWIKKLLHQ